MATSPVRGVARLLVLSLCLIPAGCRQHPAPTPAGPAVRDDDGRLVRLPQPARRVVALIPSVNETLLALGAGGRIIARSDYDREPALAHLPSIGGGLTPNIEWIAARRPDLVVAWSDQRSRAVVSRLSAVGVPVYAARVETLADAYRTTRRLGRLLGLEPQADSLVARLRRELDDVRRRAQGLPHPRVLYLIGLDPPEVAGSGTFVSELLEVAGGRNVFGDLHLWPTVSLEEVIRRQPDVLVASVYDVAAAATDAPGEETAATPAAGGRAAPANARVDLLARLRATAGWRSLRAVQEGRVAWLDPFQANRPGPHAAEAARALFRAIHPDASVAAGATAEVRP